MKNIHFNVERIKNHMLAFPGVHLLAVTKKRSIAEIQAAFADGIRMIGENRVQEMEDKYDALPEAIKKHLIGPLQSNKVRKAVRLFDVIQSIDSLPLAQKVSVEANSIGKIMRIFLQVNISEEPQKHGFFPEEIFNMYAKIVQLHSIEIAGIMCIPKYTLNEFSIRKNFHNMKKLHTKIIQMYNLNPEEFLLSMGMSADYQIALEEGATLLRIGRGIFEV